MRTFDRLAGHTPLGAAVAAILLCSAAVACPGDAGDEDQAVVEKIVRDSIGWALTKDRARLESIFTHDADLFIFHPDWNGTVVGWEPFTKNTEIFMDPRFKATHMDLRDLRVNLSRGGDVAWFSGVLDDCYEWDGRAGCWKDTRWTGVLEKRGGDWVIVQMHFSFASDKVLAEAEKSEEQESEAIQE